MANIYGTGYYSYWLNRYISNNDLLYGSSSGDYIDAGGGNDTVYASFGNDTVYGGSGNDFLAAGNHASAYVNAWGNDFVSGGSGDDVIYYSLTTNAVTLSGDEGRDNIWGGSAGDTIYGGSGNDYLEGNAGSDYITGGTGDDTVSGGEHHDTVRGDAGVDDIYGGSGNDWIVGGADGDWLTGGSGYDVFAYETANESGLSWVTADTIKDFNPAYDYLDFAQAGNQFNYVETMNYGNNFDTARDWAAGEIASGARYAFASGGPGSNGYLFADADGNGTMDTGIEMLGVSVHFFDYGDII